ncbi:MAG: sulfate adenylyltransferase [Candidatus Hydrothermarchaeales archaeon]
MKRQTPVGGKLVDRMLKGKKSESAADEALEMSSIHVGQDSTITLEMIATGVLSPLEGFLKSEDYRSVLYEKRLADGTPWTIPQTFAPFGDGREELVKKVKEGEDIALVDDDSKPVAILHVEEKFTFDREERATQIFGTTDKGHPGVDHIYRRMSDTALAGKIDMLRRPLWGPFEKYRLEPKDTWRIFYEENGWNSIVGFQTANPLHRGHEYLQKCSLEIFDGLFINPIVETTRKAYFRNEFRIKAYEAALNLYYPKESVVFAPLRVIMRYAGPREAIMHALIRRNYGCTHLILGRDHAGFANYYPKYAAQEIFGEFENGELGITPLFFREAFYCTRCASIATERTCPHSGEYHVTMSASSTQEIFRYGYVPPKEIMRPEVAQVAMQGIQPKGVDKNGWALQPPGDTIKGLFPFYLTHQRLGGYPRREALDPKSLTVEDLRTALLDVRKNADKIYDGVYEGIAHYFDISRSIASRQRSETQEEAILRQKDLISALEEKVKVASEKVHDPFMYQDKAEAERELRVAKLILGDLQRPGPEEFTSRIWNPMEFEAYRHTLDITGEICPDTLVETQKKIDEIANGDELAVITDYKLATETIPRWAKKEGYDVQVEKKGNRWEILIRKVKK